MQVIKKFTNIFDRMIDYLAIMAIFLLVFFMFSISYSVFVRYFLDILMNGLFEIWEYGLLYIPFLGAAWLLKSDGHVSMDIAVSFLKPRARAFIETITSFLGAIVSLVLTWYGALVTWDSFQAGYIISGELRTPEFLVLMIIPIGSFLLLIQFLRRTGRYFAGWRVVADVVAYKEQRL